MNTISYLHWNTCQVFLDTIAPCEICLISFEDKTKSPFLWQCSVFFCWLTSRRAVFFIVISLSPPFHCGWYIMENKYYTVPRESPLGRESWRLNNIRLCRSDTFYLGCCVESSITHSLPSPPHTHTQERTDRRYVYTGRLNLFIWPNRSKL